MIGRLWNAYIVEWHKAVFHRMTWIAPLFILLIACAIPALRPIERDGQSDYDFVLFSVNILQGNLVLLFMLIVSANLLAPEITSGLARHVLVRPIRISEWYAAKLLFAMSYGLILCALSALAPWCVALAFGDLTGVSYGGELIHTSREVQNLYLMSSLLCLPPVWAGAAVGLFFSALSRNALSAAGLAIALWLFIDIAKYPLEIDAWVFTTWLEGVWSPLNNMLNAIPYTLTNVTRQAILSSTAVFVPAVALSLVTLKRRNFSK